MALYIKTENSEYGPFHVGTNAQEMSIPRSREYEVQADGDELQAILDWNERKERLMLLGDIRPVHTFLPVSSRKIVASLDEIFCGDNNDQ